MEITPDVVVTLRPDEVFVFGSNAAGRHGGGAARIAHERFGAVWGEGHGHHGQSYAIDTMSGLDVLAREARAFVEFAIEHPDLRFLLTPVGCGIAGYTPEQIAPLFAGLPGNVSVPSSFVPHL
ncbi:A1S_2505 family phage non-structural protein [Microbacterium sp. NPDC055312]